MPHSWTPPTYAERHGLGAGDKVVAGCCLRTVLAGSLFVRADDSVVCASCMDAARASGALPDVLAELGAPAAVIDHMEARLTAGDGLPVARGLSREGRPVPRIPGHVLARRPSVVLEQDGEA